MNESNEQPSYLPRPGDLPREELMRAAQAYIEQSACETEIRFKFTCQWCGERCTLQEPGQLFENGECHKCGKTTKIDYGGFVAFMHTHKPNPIKHQ